MLMLLLVTFNMVSPHGRFIEPPSRVSAWRFGFPTLANYNDHETNCGGFGRCFLPSCHWHLYLRHLSGSGNVTADAVGFAATLTTRPSRGREKGAASRNIFTISSEVDSEGSFQVRQRNHRQAVQHWRENHGDRRDHRQPQRLLRVPALSTGNLGTRTMSLFFLTIEQSQITSFSSLPGQISTEHGQRRGHEIFHRHWNRRVFHLDPTSSGA